MVRVFVTSRFINSLQSGVVDLNILDREIEPCS